jgi:hypothetical protein
MPPPAAPTAKTKGKSKGEPPKTEKNPKGGKGGKNDKSAKSADKRGRGVQLELI